VDERLLLTIPEAAEALGIGRSTAYEVIADGRLRVDGGKVVYVRLRTPQGRQYKRTFRTKREAELFEANERTERSRGAWVDPAAGRIPLSDYAHRWLRDRSNLRPRTAELYEGLRRLHILPGLGEVNLADLTTARVRYGSPNSTASVLGRRRR
jgi:hypothetical protein